MNENPNTVPIDDVEGHAASAAESAAEATDDSDVEGHGGRFPADLGDGDDTEGHASKMHE